MPAPGPSPHAPVAVNRTILILLLGALAAMGPFSIDMYIPGFPEMAAQFGVEETRVAFTMTTYFIGIAVGQLVYGPLIDKYGRKRPLLLALALYLVSSVGCALAPTIGTLAVLRFIQALGGSAGMVVSTAIITDVYPPERRSKAFSLMLLVMGVAPIIAPSLGSFIIAHWGWRMVFHLLALFTLLIIVWVAVFLPETARYMHDERLSAGRIASDYLGVLRNRTFLFYTLGGAAAFGLIFVFVASSAFVFLTHYGLGRAAFSLIYGGTAVGTLLGNFLNGIWSERYGYLRLLKHSSLALMVLTLLLTALAWIHPAIAFGWVVAGIFFSELLLGFAYPNSVAASLVPFKELSGTASALNGGVRMGVSALVTGAVGVLSVDTPLAMFASFFVLALIGTAFFFAAKWVHAEPVAPSPGQTRDGAR